eukprot:15443630-Alexandrium_andersonii.AAC.1
MRTPVLRLPPPLQAAATPRAGPQGQPWRSPRAEARQQAGTPAQPWSSPGRQWEGKQPLRV